MEQDPSDRPLTPRQVADLFGVSVTTIAQWADTGKLPFFWTLGGRRRFHRAEVARAMAAARPVPVEGDEAAS